MAGFLNSLDKADCNCDFVTFGDSIGARAKFAMPADTELFVFYNDY